MIFCLAPHFLRASTIMASCVLDPAYLPQLEGCTWKVDYCLRIKTHQPTSALALVHHVRETNFCLRTKDSATC